MSNPTTKQEDRNPDGTFKEGYKPPTTFADRPQDRHNGAWKKEDTPRFKLEKMMQLESEELQAVANDKHAPLFERKLATAINKGQWKEIKEMMQEVYGKPRESVDVTTGGEKLNVALVEFVGGTDRDPS